MTSDAVLAQDAGHLGLVRGLLMACYGRLVGFLIKLKHLPYEVYCDAKSKERRK